MVSPPPPPPASLDLPEPFSSEQRSSYRPLSKIDPPFQPPSTSLNSISAKSYPTVFPSDHNGSASPTSPIERSETPPPPLRNLASKFANMMNLNTTVPMFGSSAEDSTGAALLQSGPRARAHGRSQSLGYFFGGSVQPDQVAIVTEPTFTTGSRMLGKFALPDLDVGPGLSGEEIERLAKEERDWSRREAEKLIRMEKKEKEILPNRGLFEEGKTPRRLTSSRSMRDLSRHQSTDTSPSAPTTTFPMPSTTSAYLVPDSSNPTTLDIPGTLALLAKRFEKLETWSVGHIKALEDRVGRFDHRVGALEGRMANDEAGVGRLRDDLDGLRDTLRKGLEELEGRLGRSSQENQSTPYTHLNTDSASSRPSLDTIETSSLRRTGSTSSARSRPLPPSPCLVSEQSFQQYRYQDHQPFQLRPETVQPETYKTAYGDGLSSSFDTHDFDSRYNLSSPPSLPHNNQKHPSEINNEEHLQHLPTPIPSPSPPVDQPKSPAVAPRKRYTSALSSRPSSAQGNYSVSEKNGLGLEDAADYLSTSRGSTSDSTSTLASSSSVGILGLHATSREIKTEDRSRIGLDPGARSTQGAGFGQNQVDQKDVILASNGKRAKVGAIVDFWDKGSRK